MTKEKIIERFKKLKELEEYFEKQKKLNDNLVLVQFPYGLSDKDKFLVPCLISKESFEQIKMYDEELKKRIEEAKQKQKQEQEQEQEQESNTEDIKEKIKSE